MHIPPKRRRRCLKVHALTLQGLSQRKIAERLNISHAAVRADQQLIETHWSEIAAPAADDLLLQQLDLLRRETARIARQDIMETFGNHITMAEYIKACDARDAKILAYLRETRRTIDAIHRRAQEREAQPDLYQDDDQGDDQSDVETAPELAETSPKLAQTVHPESASPQPEQEIVSSDAPEEKIPQKTIHPAPDPLLDPIIKEALDLFPQLKGQSPDQILTFLDQLTDPTNESEPVPEALYADAAGG